MLFSLCYLFCFGDGGDMFVLELGFLGCFSVLWFEFCVYVCGCGY